MSNVLVPFEAAVFEDPFEDVESPRIEALAALHLGIGLMLNPENPLVRKDFEDDEEQNWPKLLATGESLDLASLENQANERIRRMGPFQDIEAQRYLAYQRKFFEEMRGRTPNDARGSAAAFCFLGLYHRSPLVRVAAAIATLSFCRINALPIGLALKRLRDAIRWNGNPFVGELAWTGMSRVIARNADENSSNPIANFLRNNPPTSPQPRPQAEPTSLLVHGTVFQKHLDPLELWWRPPDPSGNNQGDFHQYLKNGLRPNVYSHQDFFRWSGGWNDYARDEAAEKLVHWMDARHIVSPDVFAHSHGCNVAMLASHARAMDRLVLMSCPVWPEYRPSNLVAKPVSIRVKWDLVIMADGGAQRFPSHWGFTEEVLPIWYAKHEVTRRSSTWNSRNLGSLL